MVRFLTIFLLALLVLTLQTGRTVVAAPGDGRKIFNSRGCGRCHSTKRPSKGYSRKDYLKSKGPALWYAGSKFRPGFLESWLTGPYPIRPMKFNSLTEKNPGDHPSLKPEEARKVAAFLMGLRSADVKPRGIRPVLNRFGRIVFIKKFACYGCHRVTVRGKPVGGLTGPDLVGVRERLSPEWIYAFLSNPRAFEPVSRMPVYAGLMSERELVALAEYVASLE